MIINLVSRNLIIYILCLLLCGCSQDLLPKKEVPAAVEAKFRAIYEGVKLLRWKKQGEFYQALFKRASLHGIMLFDEKGELVESAMEIPQKELPEGIARQVSARYPTYHFEQTAQLKSKKLEGYKITIRRGGKRYELVYDNQGVFVEKSMRLIEDEYFMIDLSFLRKI